jgi:hypothetical protein
VKPALGSTPDIAAAEVRVVFEEYVTLDPVVVVGETRWVTASSSPLLAARWPDRS